MATEHSYRTREWLVAIIAVGVFISGFVPAAVAQVPLPATIDVGSPALPGSMTISGNTFIVEGGASANPGNGDHFRMVYNQISGDQDVVARIASFEAGPATSRAGIMVRQSLATTASTVGLWVNSKGLITLRMRASNGGWSSIVGSKPASVPIWLKLARRVTGVTAFSSVDGVTWQPLGAIPLKLSEPFYVGLGVTSDDAKARARVVFDNVTLVSNQLPKVAFTAPAVPVGGVVKQTAPATLELEAAASDADGTIVRVNFYSGKTILGSDTSAPYTLKWSNILAGTYNLTVVALDNRGASTTAYGPTISVAKGSAPTVSLVAPVDGSKFVSKVPITLSASAADADGSVVRVNFFSGVKLLGSATTSPFTMTWTDAAAGVHTLTATATDNSGLVTASVSRTVTVQNNAAPAVTLTSPADASTVISPDAVTLTASASDSDGTIAKVDFYAGQTLVGSRVAAPFVVTWTNAPAGTHTLTAVATDNAGATTTSLARSISVKSNGAPSVSLTSPALNTTVTAPTTVTVTATAADSDGTVAKVDFFAGATLIGSDAVAPYLVSWANAPVGTHVLTAVATDDRGATTTSSGVAITVKGNAAPTVSLTGPDVSAPAIGPLNVQVTATAADSDGSVAKVAFYAGSTLLGTDTASPYAVTWNNAPVGTHVLTAVATDDKGAVTTAASRTLTVKSNVAPTVALTAPAASASFASGAPIALTATAADSDGTVASVSFYAGATLIGSTTASPFAATWNNAPVGTHVLTAVAKDDRGATTTSASRSITVNANAAPTVSLTSPAANANFAPPATVTLTATAADTDGTVAKVTFFAGATVVGTATASPYAATWANVVAGTYALTAVATDDKGATTTSAARTITVKANTAPTVSWTSPAANATVTTPATITLAVTATDADGSVAKVEFFAGATSLGSTTTSPYSVTWANAPVGAHVLTAIATDNQGLTTTATRTVTVSNNAAPAVSLTSPAMNAMFTTPTSIAITATASDADGTVTKVDFYAGTTLIGFDTTSPYAVTWTGAPEGSHSLTAVAHDNNGGTTVSSARTVLVSSAPLPSTVIFTPANAPTVNGYTLEIFLEGADTSASPFATMDLGLPAVVNNEISVDVHTFIFSLAPGRYFAIVAADTSEGTLRSAPSPVFTR